MTNLQGDVTAILSQNGYVMVEYTYDAWGNILTLTGTLATTLGQYNPLTYRGYVFDYETGLYYLQSRYYDPEIGRFLNADGQISGVGGDFLGYNQFAYCFNNPVNMSDDSGNWPKWLSGAINVVSGFAQGALGAAIGATVGWTGVGAVVAGALILNGAATAAQGIGQIVNDATNSTIMREDNIIRTGVQTIGSAIGGDTGGTIAGMAYDAGIMALSTYSPTSSTMPPTTPVTGACFVAGTAILTSTGLEAIEHICVGDMVWSANPDTGEKALKEVVQVFVRESNELIHIFVNGEEIITTPEHPFFVDGQGWTTAADLHSRHVLIMQNGNLAVIQKVECELLDSPILVYNFEVADFHTYYVGESAVLVHNTCQQFTLDQQAVIDLAREFKNGITRSDADILISWAREYGIKYHYPMIHPNRTGIWSEVEHIKIFNLHIPIK